MEIHVKTELLYAACVTDEERQAVLAYEQTRFALALRKQVSLACWQRRGGMQRAFNALANEAAPNRPAPTYLKKASSIAEQKVLDNMNGHEHSYQDLQRATNMGRNALSNALCRLAAKKLVQRVSHGKYARVITE